MSDDNEINETVTKTHTECPAELPELKTPEAALPFDEKGAEKISYMVLFFASMVTLGLEILLTRIFSVVLFASHSFMAISLALLGTGSGAILAYLGKQLPKDKHQRRQILLMALLSLTLVVSLWALLQIEFVPQEMEDPETGRILKDLSYNKRSTMVAIDPELFNMNKLYAALPLAFLPFLLMGYLQAMIFRGAPKKFGKLYGVDLIGATVGSIFLPLLLYPFGLVGTLSFVSLLALVPVIYFYLFRDKKRDYLIACAVPIVVLSILLLSGSFKVKHAAGFSVKDTKRELWSPMARVTLMDYKVGNEMYVIDNGSRTYYVPKTPVNVQRYMDSLYTIPFEMKKGGSTLIIASGGGQEIIIASHFGMSRIDAVEISRPLVMDIVKNKKDEVGNPYLLPNVHYFIADGRSVAMRARNQYDVIEMLEVNFHTLAGQISQAWSPLFVFTQEAFSEYFEHLKDDGYLCYTIFSRGDKPVGGGKGRRFRSIVAGMKMAGIKRPQKNFAILCRPYVYGHRTMVMAKKQPYTDDELVTIREISSQRKARIKIQYPDLRRVEKNKTFNLPAGEKLQPDRKYIKDVKDLCVTTRPEKGLTASLRHRPSFKTPITDDRPYSFGSGLIKHEGRGDVKEKLIGGLYRTLLGIMIVLAFVFVILPFVIRRPGGGERVRIDPRLLLILSMTGIGFMFIEMAGIYKYQLYLHHPTIALIVILSSMILGAGIGSLHTNKISDNQKERGISIYSFGAILICLVLFLLMPLAGHKLMLWMPLPLLVGVVFLVFSSLGFMLGHVVPLSIAVYTAGQSNILAWCWAITVTGSVFGTVFASILARDFGMFLVAMLGVGAYCLVITVNLVGGRIVKKQGAK